MGGLNYVEKYILSLSDGDLRAITDGQQLCCKVFRHNSHLCLVL